MAEEAVARQMHTPQQMIDEGVATQVEYAAPKVVTAAEVKEEFGFESVGQTSKKSQVYLPEVSAKLRGAADAQVANILAAAKGTIEDKQKMQLKIEQLGLKIQQDAASMNSEILDTKIKDFTTRLKNGKGTEGEEVAKALVDLRDQVEDLDPTRVDFKQGWARRIAKHIPFVGDKVANYFTRYQSAQTVIAEIFGNLEAGGEKLARNNVIARDMQVKMRTVMAQLEEVISLGQLMQKSVQAEIEKQDQNSEDCKFLKQEVLFTLQQRIVDLQQQLAVNQQGILTMAIIIGNNKELIRAINQAMTVTRNALSVAVATAIFLNDQEVILTKIQGINATTVAMMARNAKRLKTQGVDIQKQASSMALDMKTLESCYADIIGAMDDIASFREKAIVEQADNIIKLNELNGKARESIIKMEKGQAAKEAMGLGA